MQADLSAITLLQLPRLEHVTLNSDGCKSQMIEGVQEMVCTTA